MTPDDPDAPDAQVDPVPPEDEARIRRLLSEARETGPVPADVAARLDRTLAGLVEERAIDQVPADVVASLARTRRHRVVALLGAAAAVAVVALGIGTFFADDEQSMDDAGTAASAPERGEDAADAAPEREDASATEGQQKVDGTGDEAGVRMEIRFESDRPPYLVHSRHLALDLARIQADALRPAVRYERTTILAPRAFSCPSADWGRGFLVAARYDGAPVYVAFRRPMGDSQVVDVLQCGTADLLRSTTLPTAG